MGNVETSPLPGSDYDAIYFNSSLHHMSDLDSILQSCSNALKHDGYLFINEYIGPNRFDFSKREREVMTSVFQTIPIKYRISQADYDKGKIRTHLAFPSPEEVDRVDPSEAIKDENHFNLTRVKIIEARTFLLQLITFIFGYISFISSK